MAPEKPLKRLEFIVLFGMMFATIAFSIDSMLPALPEIGAELTPDNLNRAQLILTSFVLGMGLGTFFMGPLSDTFGRRRVLLSGFVLYGLGTVLAIYATSLELVLAARVLQGVGAAGPRVVTTAIIRDQFAGRQMARILSFIFMVFTIVPAIAPSMGAMIIHFFGWRGVFGAFLVFALVFGGWFFLRQPETLPVEKRRAFTTCKLWSGVREVWGHRTVRIAVLAQGFALGALFAMLSSTQQIFDKTFDQGDNFPLWFGGIAVVSGSASIVNAAYVVRLGMRLLIRVTLTVQLVISTIMVLGFWGGFFPGWLEFPAFVLWQATVFFMAGMVLGNLNAIALEPMGHLAGMAASITSAISTVMAAGMAIPVGLAFDGTPAPLAAGILLLVAAALGLMQLIRSEDATHD
jgi:DHA1 family bicyclomycin/chloramphenicol resistance-like MFS transporter